MAAACGPARRPLFGDARERSTESSPVSSLKRKDVGNVNKGNSE